MEAGGESYFAIGIDAEKRNASLDVVQAALDVPALLQASRDHFNETASLLDADRILEEFRDNNLSADLRSTEGFDPELFKACLLFELSHLESDDSEIPEYVQLFADFWKGDPDDTRESLERTFTAETKRFRYEPFPVMSQFIVLSIALHSSKKYEMQIESSPPKDPIQEDIDGREFRVFMGGEELKFDEPPVLTRQLQKDLGKFLPGPVLSELRYRFPDDATFEDVQRYIEQIQQERSHEELPSDEELITCFRRLGGRAIRAANNTNELEAAKDFFIDVHRSLKSRLITYDIYVPGVRAWYVVQALESDTEPNVFYRRIFYGDMSTPETLEVPIDQRQLVIDELERERRAIGEYPGSLQQDEITIHDVMGSYKRN